MVKITRTPTSITISGHAGYAAKGYDIVCSAVSALAQTLVYSLRELTDDEIAYKMATGYIFIEYRDLSDSAKLLIESFFVGVKGCKDAYPEYIDVDIDPACKS